MNKETEVHKAERVPKLHRKDTTNNKTTKSCTIQQSNLFLFSMMVSTPAELMIIVMGVTGTGKSSFLKLLTGNDAIRISHSECCKLATLYFHHSICH